MAIDPSISLAVRPVQMPLPNIQSPVDQLGQVLSLRNLMQQGQSGALELQTRQLNLDQLRRQMQEQQDYADAMRAYAQGGSTAPAPAGAAPVQTPTVPAPPVQTAPAQSPPVGLTGGPESVPGLPNVGALPSPPPGAPLGGLMTPATAPAAPAVASPVMGAQGLSRLGGMNAAQFIARFPLTGLSRVKEAFALDQAEAEAGIKQHDLNMGIADEFGRAGRAVRDSKSPATQFVTELTQLGNNGRLPWPTVRQMISDGYDAHKNDIDAFIAKAQNGKDSSEIAKTDLEALGTAQKNAAATVGNVTDQASLDQWLPQQDRRVQAMVGPTYHPGLVDAVRVWGVPGAEQPKMQMSQRDAASQVLAAARAQGDDAYQNALKQFPPDVQAVFASAKTPLQVRQLALDSEKYVNAIHQNLQTVTEAEKIRLDREKFNAEFGDGTAESWAAQVYANPDTVKDIPTNMRTAALKAFNTKYPGLPFPTPLEGASKQQETASQNTKGDIEWIRNALKNPNIANNVGPLLGNIQNVEQATGMATGLTGADAQMAQEFRTRMRQMLANEAGSMHARINPKTLDDLAKSSGKITMNVDMLKGALDGVEGSVNQRLTGFERQRFGGQTRPPEARGITTGAGTVKMKAPDGTVRDIPSDQVDHYKSIGATVVQ